MKIYEDQEKKKPLNVIYFGIVKAGGSKTVQVYLYNDSSAMLTNLEFQIKKNIPEAKQISIIDPPVTIQPQTFQPLKIKWSPSKTFKRALEIMIIIKGEEVYMAMQKFRVEKVKE